ncbi:guanylate kinase [Oleoguttula sp. CCFEE 5521]
MAPTPSPSSKRPLVVSGPSGSGKSTLLSRLFEAYPKDYTFSISHTTRAPRGAEQNGKEYHFVTKQEFEKMIDEGGFIEHAQFGGNRYGTSFMAVREGGKKEGNEGGEGRRVVLDIEMEGVKQVHKTDLNARFVFLQPPSVEILEQRLRGRGTDKEEAIVGRLKQAEKEIEYSKTEGAHDRIIINDDLEKAWEEFREWVREDEEVK